MRLALLFMLALTACGGEKVDETTTASPSDDAVVSYERETHPPEYYIDGYTFTDPMEHIPIGDYRQLIIRFEDEREDTYYVHVDHVDEMIEAKMAMYVDPGVNMRDGRYNVQLTSIVVIAPMIFEPNWTTQANLEEPASLHDGAWTLRWDNILRAWNPDDGWLYPGDIPFGGF